MPNILTPLDMHIEVLQGLQKVDGFQQDIFSPEEIDLHLNKHQDRFIEQMVNKKFEETQVRLDYIKNLIVKDRVLTAFLNPEINTPSNYLTTESQGIYSVLPSDYLHLIADSVKGSRLLDGCTGPISITNKVVDVVEDIAVLPFPPATPDPESTIYFYIGLQISAGATVIYDSRFGQTVTAPDYKGIIIKDILENFNTSGVPGLEKYKIYWENYRDEYYPDSFIFVTESSVTTPIAFKVTTQASNGDPLDDIDSVALTPITYSKIDSQVAHADATTTQTNYQNKLDIGDHLYEDFKNIFYQPVIKEAHSSLADGKLYVYGATSYIITDSVIDYVRKPRQISLSLNQTCELAGTAPRLIVDATIEYLKLLIENPGYQGLAQDNQLRNQNNL